MTTTPISTSGRVLTATHDERTLKCVVCAANGDSTVLLYAHKSSRSIWRRTDIELVMVGQNENRYGPHIVLRDYELDTQAPDEVNRSRVDITSGVNVDDVDFPLEIECHRCGHRLPRGLGRRRFDTLMADDGPIVI